MDTINCRLFGVFQVTLGGAANATFHSDKARALLAYLALEPGEHQRTQLAALLWPDIGDKYALTNLRTTLHRLRQSLDGAAPGAADRLLTVTRHTVRFNQNAAWVDVLAFRDFLARPGASTGDMDSLEAAVALYRGELLSGFGVADAAPFEEWLLLRREYYHQQAVWAFRSLVAAYEQAGRYQAGYALANRLHALDPYAEETSRQMMRLLARMGNADQALDHFERLRKRLQTELGVEPSAESVALIGRIVAGEYADGVTVADLGGGKPRGASADNIPVASEMHALQLHEVPEPGLFFGRAEELQQVTAWLLEERSRVVAILGIGGMGKTTLATQCVRELASRSDSPFDAVYWRSLVNAPPLTELLSPLLQALSHQQLTHIPENVDEQLRLLLGYLRERRVLLVLDNLESLLEPGQAGAYQPGYEPYGQLIRQVATMEHQSHLVLTSREHPRGYHRLERDGYPVKSLALAGLDNEAGYQLLLQRGLQDDNGQEATLIARYSGNPLALKLVADTVDDIFGGDVAEFLADDTLIFDDIRTVLDQHFMRLTDLEQQLLFWLAIERETTTLATLRSNLLDPPPQRVLLETLRNLQRRSLMERQADGFVLQNVVTEYLTDRLVGDVYTEIRTGALHHLHYHALVQSQSKEYIRQSQIRVFLKPLLQRLETDLTTAGLRDRLQALIQHLQADYGLRPSYAAGTILNAMIYLGWTLEGVDLSGICLWQADLRNRIATHLNLAGADLSRSLFSQTFGRVEAVAVSPDGEKFAIGGDGGYVRVYGTASRQFLSALSGHTNTVAGLAFGADSNLLASASHDGTVRLWNLARQEEIHLWEMPGAMLAVKFSRDGALLIGVGHTGRVYLWDVASGVLRTALDGHTASVRALAVHPDRDLLATGSGDGEIRLWELGTDRLDETGSPGAAAGAVSLQHDVNAVIALAFSPDGARLASGNRAGDIAFWNPDDLAPLAAFQAHSMEARALAFGPESRYLYSGGGGGASSIRIWDVTRNELLARLLQDETTWSLGLTPDGKTLVSGREDGTVHLWNVAEPSNTTLIHTVYGYRMSLNTLAWSPCGRWLATGDVHGDIFVWDVSAGQPSQRYRFNCENGPVVSVAFSPDGNRLASASGAARQYSVCLWDTTSGIRLATMRTDMEQFNVAFVRGGEGVVGSGRDGALRYWEFGVPGSQPTTSRIHDKAGRFYVTCDRTGMLLVTHGESKTVDVWAIGASTEEPPTLRHSLTGHGANRAVAIDADANLLACLGPAGSIVIWRLAAPGEEALLHALEGHTNQISSIAFSPGGSRLASCGFDRSVRLWDVETGRQLALLGKHSQFALGVTFSPDGSRVASIGKEGLLFIWNSHTGEQEHVLKAPSPYDGMNITGVTGISEAQRAALKTLGAVES